MRQNLTGTGSALLIHPFTGRRIRPSSQILKGDDQSDTLCGTDNSPNDSSSRSSIPAHADDDVSLEGPLQVVPSEMNSVIPRTPGRNGSFVVSESNQSGSFSEISLSAIPVILERMNRVILRMLPVGGMAPSSASEPEEPPQYTEV